MRANDLNRLERAAEWLGFAFYGLLLIAAAAALSDAPGWGFLFLLAGGAAHVGRASFEEFVEAQRARGRSKPGPKLEVRRQTRPATRRGSRPHQRAKRPIASRAPAQ